KKNKKIQIFAMSGAKHVSANEQKTTITTVKHGGGPVVLWRCFTDARNGNSDFIRPFWQNFGMIVLLESPVIIKLQSVRQRHQKNVLEWPVQSVYSLYVLTTFIHCV
uniref:Uncharacterized protein n=1 Tax=Cyprinus carpio TaxID=7962 RepID=A0A8C1YHS4_CYPCA